MSKDTKVIRGQIRQIVQELFPKIVAEEAYLEIIKLVNTKLNEIEGHVKSTLHEINTNHKNTMGYLVRQSTQVKSDEK